MSPSSAPGSPVVASARRDVTSSPGLAIALIWASTVLSGVLAPDMITGSAHEHLPMSALTGWIWALVATGYVLMAARGGRGRRSLVLGTSITWLLVAAAVVFGPVMVTGTDPTTIPLTVLIAPVAGAIVTGFLALAAATSSDQPSAQRNA